MKKVMINSILTVGLIGMATSALAIDAKDIINRMETRGYTDIETSTTLFGNTLIVGIIDGSKHEFVINKSGIVYSSERFRLVLRPDTQSGLVPKPTSLTSIGLQ